MCSIKIDASFSSVVDFFPVKSTCWFASLLSGEVTDGTSILADIENLRS